MNTKQILEKAYHLLDDPERWTKGSLAFDANGMLCDPQDEKATQWCAIGALQKYAPDRRSAKSALMALRGHLPYGCEVYDINDGRDGYRRIRAAFRRAIRSCE